MSILRLPSAFQLPASWRTTKFGERSDDQSTLAGSMSSFCAPISAHMHAGEIGRVAAHAACDLGLGDRERHRPGRIEIDRGDIDRERRRRLVDLADDDAITPLDLAVGNRLDEGRRNVDHDVALGKDKIHAEQPLQRCFELLDAIADRDIERFQGRRADAAGRIEAVAQLEALDALDDGGVIDVAALLPGRHVAADDEMPAQAPRRRDRLLPAQDWRWRAAPASRRAPGYPNS